MKHKRVFFVLLSLLCICAAVAVFLNGRFSIFSVAGKYRIMMLKESIGNLEYYQDYEATYIFRDDELVGIEEPKIRNKLEKYSDLKQKAYYAADRYIDMSGYSFLCEDDNSGGCHVFIWAVFYNGIESDERVTVDIFEDGSVNNISFPNGITLSKNKTPKELSAYLTKESAVAAFQNEIYNGAELEVTRIEISECRLSYNKSLVPVWEITGGYYAEFDDSEEAFYAEVHINALSGEIIYSQLG